MIHQKETLYALCWKEIKQRASQLKVFISMVRQIPGMDQIADTLELTGISCGLLITSASTLPRAQFFNCSKFSNGSHIIYVLHTLHFPCLL